MSFLTNPWVIGIGSGLIVSLISTVIFLRREIGARKQKIETANNEILFSIRLSMNAGEFPSLNIIDSLINSTALKYKIKGKHLFTLPTLTDLLIKEIMDNALITTSKKSELCKLIETEKRSSELLATTKEKSKVPAK